MVISHDLGVIAAVCDAAQVMYAGQIVERAPIESMLSAPEHPYTRALLNLVPRLDHSKHRRLHPIAGSPPSLSALPPGCRFAPRCEHRFDRCDDEPPLRPVAAGHTSRCWLNECDFEAFGFGGILFARHRLAFTAK